MARLSPTSSRHMLRPDHRLLQVESAGPPSLKMRMRVGRSGSPSLGPAAAPPPGPRHHPRPRVSRAPPPRPFHPGRRPPTRGVGPASTTETRFASKRPQPVASPTAPPADPAIAIEPGRVHHEDGVRSEHGLRRKKGRASNRAKSARTASWASTAAWAEALPGPPTTPDFHDPRDRRWRRGSPCRRLLNMARRAAPPAPPHRAPPAPGTSPQHPRPGQLSQREPAPASCPDHQVVHPGATGPPRHRSEEFLEPC